jgi:hypothetical protein
MDNSWPANSQSGVIPPNSAWGVVVAPQPSPNPFDPMYDKPKLTLAQALLNWDNAKKALGIAKEAELEARKVAFDLGFGKEAKEGTNTITLSAGYELKGVKKLNYKLKAPADFKGDKVDAVDACADKFRKISNEGAFVAERLFKYDVDLSITEYRKLVEEAEFEAPKQIMLTELNKILEITEATPTLEIKEPKAKK